MSTDALYAILTVSLIVIAAVTAYQVVQWIAVYGSTIHV